MEEGLVECVSKFFLHKIDTKVAFDLTSFAGREKTDNDKTIRLHLQIYFILWITFNCFFCNFRVFSVLRNWTCYLFLKIFVKCLPKRIEDEP